MHAARVNDYSQLLRREQRRRHHHHHRPRRPRRLSSASETRLRFSAAASEQLMLLRGWRSLVEHCCGKDHLPLKHVLMMQLHAI